MDSDKNRIAPEDVIPSLIFVSEETHELLQLVSNFIKRECIGKNDMTLVSALVVNAASMIAVHCQRTGQDYDETAILVRQMFEHSIKIMKERI